MKYRSYLISSAWLLAVLVNAVGPVTPSPFWKNQVEFPDDPFRSSSNPFGGQALPGWIKFSILLDDPATVYFQDSQQYAFHYDFASELLDPFIGMTREQFDAVTLNAEGQRAVLGAVFFPPTVHPFPPSPGIAEYGIQFARRDPYPREQLHDLFNVVRAGVVADPGVQAFYFPTFEQRAAAEADRDWLADQGVPISSADRWAEGWALGELKYFAAEEIDSAFLAGQLLPGDILLTDGVPAEVPLMAGILTLEPGTPNSHVAILARTFGVPFVHLVLTEDIDRAWALIGHRIGLRATTLVSSRSNSGRATCG